MDSHEVMKEVLKRTSAKQISADMGLSLSLIYKWAEPPEDDSGSGASSPLDRVGQLVRITQGRSHRAMGLRDRLAAFTSAILMTSLLADR